MTVKTPTHPDLGRLRAAAAVYYDTQRLRISTANRGRPRTENESVPALTALDTAFFASQSKAFKALEKTAEAHIVDVLKETRPEIYTRYLAGVRGIGPVMSAVLLTGFDITRSDMISSYWQYAGLGANLDAEGNACIQRRTRGQKTTYNPELKTRLLGVMASGLMKAYSLDAEGYYYFEGGTCSQKRLDPSAWCAVCAAKLAAEQAAAKAAKPKKAAKRVRKKEKAAERVDDLRDELTPEELDAKDSESEGAVCAHRRKVYVDPKTTPVWRKICDDRKHRRRNQIGPCSNCQGTGTALEAVDDEGRAAPKDSETKPRKKVKCWNCEGTGTGPWGKSDAHRLRDGLRVMTKEFLRDYIKAWKEIEGLPLRPPYEVEKLGQAPHSSPMPKPSTW